MVEIFIPAEIKAELADHETFPLHEFAFSGYQFISPEIFKHNKHEVIVFHVIDNQTELLFEFEDRPMEFVDLETNEKIKLNPGDIKQQYRIEADKFHKSLKMRCNQYKIDFVEADVQSDFNSVLQTYLIKRAKMR